jgi:xanthine dehydrogenase molybdenum-binding subunit
VPDAAVIAESPHIADEALSLIEVDYERLASAVDFLQAMQPSTAKQWDNKLDGTITRIFPPSGEGDPNRALTEADATVENTTLTPYQQHATLEMPTSIHQWQGDQLVVYLSGNSMFGAQKSLANTLGLPLHKVRVIGTGYVGGTFSSRGHQAGNYEEEVLPAVLSRMVGGRPVKYQWTRAETFILTGHRGRTVLKVQLGAKRDGTLTAMTFDTIHDNGAQMSGGVDNATKYASQLYDFKNYAFSGVEVFTNSLQHATMRGVSRTYAIFGIDSAMDRLADKLGMDPLELRLKNLRDERGTSGMKVAAGSAVPHGTFADPRPREVLLKAAEMVGWKEKWHRPRTREVRPGVFHGMAIGLHMDEGAQGPAVGEMKLNPDGTAIAISGSNEIGGLQRTRIMLLAAETLGIPLQQVSIASGVDTLYNRDTGNTGGSQQMANGGWGIVEAALDVKRQLLERAARRFKADAKFQLGTIAAGDLDTSEGRVFVKADPSKSMTFREAVGFLTAGEPTGGDTIVGQGVHDFGEFIEHHGFYSNQFGAQAIELEIDVRTGTLNILKYAAVEDVGQAINMLAVEDQIQGGTVYGLGAALSEELLTDMATGLPINPSVLDYRVPTINDVPPIDVGVLEFPKPQGPFGAHSFGQGPTGQGSALLNQAVFNATGVWVDAQPLTRYRIMQALKRATAG